MSANILTVSPSRMFVFLHIYKHVLNPPDEVHGVVGVFIRNTFAKNRVIGEDCIYIESNQLLYGIGFIDRPDENVLACILELFDVGIIGKGLLDADNVGSFQCVYFAETDDGCIRGQDIGIDPLDFLDGLIVLGCDVAVVQVTVFRYDIDRSLNDAVIMAVSFDFDIEEQVFAEPLQHFSQGRYLCAGVFFTEMTSGIQILDLIIGDVPYIFIETRCPLQVVVMQKDDLAVLCHLDIELRGCTSGIESFLKSRYRVFGGCGGETSVSHDERETVMRVKHPAGLGENSGTGEKYTDADYGHGQKMHQGNGFDEIPFLRIGKDRLIQLLFPVVIERLMAGEERRGVQPGKTYVGNDVNRHHAA